MSEPWDRNWCIYCRQSGARILLPKGYAHRYCIDDRKAERKRRRKEVKEFKQNVMKPLGDLRKALGE